MLISPPFLPPRGNQTEEQWFEIAMSGGRPGAGAYPVSAQLDWHGGIHLTAPMNGTTAEPVRAIADGTVVFVREPTTSDDPQHPLRYGGGYTSNGVVVLRHETEIGADAQGRPTTVRFYSLYNHLYSVHPTVMRNRSISRKDAIGQAGHIYGVPNQIHFEIRCDEANLQKIIGRTAGDLPLDRDGRTDVLYGEMYFHIPAGAPVYGQRPLSNSPVARIAGPTGPNAAGTIALQPITQTAEAMMVGVRYASGRGPVGQRGDAFVTSYRLDGSTYGPARIESATEYRLYQDCMAISRSYPAASQPAPSAVLELLRFGRVIGPDHLTPADVPHWRQVVHAGGTGWINLNAANVRKYSDADYPQWKGWKLIADDVNGDARCDSPTVRSWLNQDKTDSIDPISGIAALTQENTANRMRKTICRLPCEWNAATLNSRWQWLQTADKTNPKPMTAVEYKQFIEHANALCFDCQEITEAQWTFDPKTFIAAIQHCNWMTATEFAQCFPRNLLHLNVTRFVSSTTPWATAIREATEWCYSFNCATRRFGLSFSRQRLLHLLSHVIPETGNLTLVKEIRGEHGRYAPYYGRGLIQLTWLENYQKYGNFRKFTKTLFSGTYHSLGWDPDDLVARDNNGHHNCYNCADSACFYVIQRANMMAHMDAGTSTENAVAVSRDVNGDVAIENLNGLEVRLQSVVYLKDVLFDEPATALQIPITFTWRRSSNKETVLNSQGQPIMSGTPPKPKLAYRAGQHTIDVSLQRQKPPGA